MICLVRPPSGLKDNCIVLVEEWSLYRKNVNREWKEMETKNLRSMWVGPRDRDRQLKGSSHDVRRLPRDDVVELGEFYCILLQSLLGRTLGVTMLC